MATTVTDKYTYKHNVTYQNSHAQKKEKSFNIHIQIKNDFTFELSKELMIFHFFIQGTFLKHLKKVNFNLCKCLIFLLFNNLSSKINQKCCRIKVIKDC